VHQDLILNTASGKSSQLRPLVRTVAFNGFDESDRSDGDQILHILTGVIEFFEVMDMIRCQLNQELF